MDIFILILFSLVIISLNFNKFDSLDKKNTLGIKGIMAIIVIFHHLSQQTTTEYNFENFKYMGTYAVSIFFFLSAYGLYYQLNNKENYLKNFVSKRILPLFITISFMSFIYYIYYSVILKLDVGKEYFISLLKNGSTLILNGWFLNVIIAVYVIFYILFKYVHNRTIAFIIFNVILIGYIFIAIKLGYGAWWYNTILVFPLGILWFNYKDNIEKFIKEFYWQVLILLCFILFISYHYHKILSILKLSNSYTLALAGNFNNIVFTLFFLTIILKLNFKNKLFYFLGNISLELYMIHGLIMNYLGIYFISSRKNDVLYSLSTILISIILAWIINKIISYSKKLFLN